MKKTMAISKLMFNKPFKNYLQSDYAMNEWAYYGYKVNKQVTLANADDQSLLTNAYNL